MIDFEAFWPWLPGGAFPGKSTARATPPKGGSFEIKEKAMESTAPILIHEEGDIIKRALRDIYDNDTKYVHVVGIDGFQIAKFFMNQFMPRNSKFVKK